MSKLVNVAIGVLVERRGGRTRVLIARRPEHAPLGGYWELPGGKVEGDESLATTLVREFGEEVGLCVRVGEALPVIEHRYPHVHIRLHPFFCERLAGEPRNLAVAEHRWVGPHELVGYRFPPANAGLMAELPRLIEARWSAADDQGTG